MSQELKSCVNGEIYKLYPFNIDVSWRSRNQDESSSVVVETTQRHQARQIASSEAEYLLAPLNS